MWMMVLVILLSDLRPHLLPPSDSVMTSRDSVMTSRDSVMTSRDSVHAEGSSHCLSVYGL